MNEITGVRIARVGVDLAKQVIQVHAVDASGQRVAARGIKREQFVLRLARVIRLLELLAPDWPFRYAVDCRQCAANFSNPSTRDQKLTQYPPERGGFHERTAQLLGHRHLDHRFGRTEFAPADAASSAFSDVPP
jgi:hypothetical protein